MRVIFRLNDNHDADVISWCRDQANVSAAIRSLIRQAIRRDAEINAALEVMASDESEPAASSWSARDLAECLHAFGATSADHDEILLESNRCGVDAEAVAAELVKLEKEA